MLTWDLGGFPGLGRRLFNCSRLQQPTQQRLHATLKRALIRPLPVDKFLDGIDRFEAKINDLLRWLDLSVAKAANQIFGTVRNAGDAL